MGVHVTTRHFFPQTQFEHPPRRRPENKNLQLQVFVVILVLMIRVLFFDNDGVLAHTEELFFEINSKVFADMDIEYSRKDFEHLL